MDKYYNDSLGKDFSSKVSELRSKLGTNTFISEKSTFGIAGNTFEHLQAMKSLQVKFIENGQSL
ncbi:MAG: hypothetical protein IPJ13_01820 [Saprospiraceae bacterium]|nr:hypothetical protein [Saprospiraceae bacterium]